MEQRTCVIEDCERPAKCRGWCGTHYTRWYRTGDPLQARPLRRVVDTAAGRECNRCREIKSLEGFPKARGGRGAVCRECRRVEKVAYTLATAGRRRTEEYRAKDRASARAYYRRNRDARVEETRRRYREDPTLWYEGARRRRARMAAVEVDPAVTVASLRARLGDDCCYCGQVMDFGPTKGRGVFPPDKVTVEHFMPISQGGAHTYDNTALACWSCNLSRGARNLDEWLAEAGFRDPRCAGRADAEGEPRTGVA